MFVSKIKTFKKKKSKFERPFNGNNDQFACQKCKKVRITGRIFPKELENSFELYKFSNYGDSNYRKQVIKVSWRWLCSNKFVNLFEYGDIRIMEIRIRESQLYLHGSCETLLGNQVTRI